MKKRSRNIYLLAFVLIVILVGYVVITNNRTRNEIYMKQEKEEKFSSAKVAEEDFSNTKMEEIIEKENIINISDCSDEFMDNYFEEMEAFNEKLSKEDEKTQDEMKSNMLIVISKEEPDSDEAIQTIKAPNNTYFLVYETNEEMEKAKEKLAKDDNILSVDNNVVYEISEDNEDVLEAEEIMEENIEVKMPEVSNDIKHNEEADINKDEEVNHEEDYVEVQATYNSWGVQAMGLDTALTEANSRTSEEVIVAIIDTGCNLELFESKFQDKIKGYHDVTEGDEFVDEVGHGTHIAGTIAEATPKNVKIYPIKVSRSTKIYNTDIITGINYVVDNDIADVINMSFGGYSTSQSMYTAITAANSKNIISVAAAGNDNVGTNCYPACYDNTISVSACTKALEKSSFSNYNDAVTFTAPGSSILSINGTSNGTSMATPHVVSAVAIYKAYNKSYTLENVIEALKTNCIDLGPEGKDKNFGYGFINLKNITYCDCSCKTCDSIYCLGCNCGECEGQGDSNNSEAIANLEVVSSNPLTYNYGSLTNLSNITLKIQYNDNSIEQVNLLELEDCEILNYDPYSAETQTIIVNYKGKSVTITLNAQTQNLGWEYESNGDKTVKLTGFKSSSEIDNIILYIPEKINGNTVTEIGKQVFYENSNLNKLILTSNITKIDEYAFYKCENLKTVKSSSTELHIMGHAFDSCTNMDSKIKGIKQVDEYAFYQCNKLKSIEFAEGIKEIGENAFSYTGLSTVVIPNGLETIGKEAFYSCESLAQIMLSNTLQTIGSKAFYNCTNIFSVEIPESITSISSDAFGKCSNISEIIVNDSNLVYDSRDNCNSIIETQTNKLIVGSNYSQIPDTVTVIGANAFSGRINLAVVQFSNSITAIEEKAFEDCKYLQYVVCPKTIKSISENAFANCPNLIMYVYKDSAAKKYAVDNDIEYRHIDASISNVVLKQYVSKTYKAFETVDMDGVIVRVVFDDYSYVDITEGYVVEYENGNDSFRYGDTTFMIYYNQDGFGFRAAFAVTVEKAIPEYQVPTNLTAKKGQKLSEIELPDGFEWMDDSITIEEIGTNIYNAKFVPEDSENYKTIEDIEISVEVTEKEDYLREISEIEGITKTSYIAFETVNEQDIKIKLLYNSGETKIVTSGYNIKYQNENNGFRYGDTKYTIEYTEDGITVSKEVSVTVEKATPKYTKPTGLIAKRGQKLSGISLPKGFSWMNSSTIISEIGNKTFKVKYTPTDTKNYKVVENISVTVNVIKEDQNITINNLNRKNSFVYGFKVKTVDFNRNVLSSYKVKSLQKDIKLSSDLIYEVYDNTNKKLSSTSDITTGCKIKIYSQPVSSVKELIRTYYTVIYGDTNCDGIINSGDLLAIKKHLLGTRKFTDNATKESSDINQDGTINSADLLFLKKHLLGKQIINLNKY